MVMGGHAFKPNTWDHTAYVINVALRSSPSTSKLGGRLGMEQSPYWESPSRACSSGFNPQLIHKKSSRTPKHFTEDTQMDNNSKNAWHQLRKTKWEIIEMDLKQAIPTSQAIILLSYRIRILAYHKKCKMAPMALEDETTNRKSIYRTTPAIHFRVYNPRELKSYLYPYVHICT